MLSDPDPESLIPPELLEILATAPELQRAYLVGGCIRDWLLGRPSKDIDIEVFGIDYETLANKLSKWGRTDLVGKSFGVVILTLPSGRAVDFTIPRRDSKIAPGHKGFEIEFDPEISMEEAASRRDFTINALMFDPRKKRIHDFFNGTAHLEERLLVPTSTAFAEDPLRVLRAMQFAGRFNFDASVALINASQEIHASFGELAVDRIREEWCKWATKSTVPSAGLRLLRDTGWIGHFPEISALVDTPQDAEWHPEGDVFTHTQHCCDAMARLSDWQTADEATRAVLMFAVLAHDFGKPAVTERVVREGIERIISPGHDRIGGELTTQFLERIGISTALQKRIPPLVICHMAHLQTTTARSIRRLANRLKPETIEHLTLVIEADQRGRPPLCGEPSDELLNLKRMSAELNLGSAAPCPILLGRDLIKIHGLKPGPRVGAILKMAFEAQLDGEFTDRKQALAWLVKHLEENNQEEVMG